MHIVDTVFVSFEVAEMFLGKNGMLRACMSCRLLLLKRCAGGMW